MHSELDLGTYGVPLDTKILTADGWQPVTAVAPGTRLVHPTGLPSKLVAVVPLGERRLYRLRMADGTGAAVTEDQRIRVRLGEGTKAPVHALTAVLIHDAILRGRPIRLPRNGTYEFGEAQHLPIPPYLLGLLLGDGYLRQASVELCNQQAEVHDLARRELPADVRLTEMRVGQAGTGSTSIVGRARGHNSVVTGLRELGLAGKRAWEKFIPSEYLHAPMADRVALFQGLMDTDGSIDAHGRMEFSSSSEMLCLQMLELIHSLGGRASYAIKSSVQFTSPRQKTPKAGRPSHRLTNIRPPDDLAPFRRGDRAGLVRAGRLARQWKVRGVEPAGSGQAVAVVVSARDSQWIANGHVVLTGSPAEVQKVWRAA